MADSPSQTLMDCMEQFGEAEPQHVLVIWADEGQIRFKHNAASDYTAIGLMHGLLMGLSYYFQGVER